MSPDPRYDPAKYPQSELTGEIIACCMEVHKTLGPGFEEVFYQRALLREMDAAGLEAAREVNIEVTYKGLKLGKKRVDFWWVLAWLRSRPRRPWKTWTRCRPCRT